MIGFKGHLNDSAHFQTDEYEVQWITEHRYADFKFSNEFNSTCDYPKFWNETGFPLTSGGVENLTGCYNSDFDQHGELEAFGNFPDWQRQLTKFASVQDRLREWHKPVRDVIARHYCIQIASLDIDGFRYDKAVQATLEPLADISAAFRECAKKYGKDNFFLPGEITSGNTFGSLYLNRGRQPNQRPDTAAAAIQLKNNSDPQYFLREDGHQAVDAVAFHYTIYRSMTRFLGMDGNLVAGFDLPTDFIDAWNQMLVTNDLLNPSTGELDPRHMYGVSNQDNFRWPAIKNGTEKYLLGLFVVTLVLPGIPLTMWGEEQEMYVFDATATNYLFGRQPLTYQTAWWTHGCWNLTTTKFFDFPNERGLYGCHDINVTYDQRNPAHPIRNIMKRMFEIREQYPVANDGMYLQTLSQITKDVYLPGSSDTPTVTGLWSVLRSYPPGAQKETDSKRSSRLWLVYHNDNKTVTYSGDCKDPKRAILAPYQPRTKLKNLFYPYDELSLQDGPGEIDGQGNSENYGCVHNMTLPPWGYSAYVEADSFNEPGPTITDFRPGHDARLLASEDTGETVEIQLGYSKEMDCNSIEQSISLGSTTQTGTTPSLDTASVSCNKVTPQAGSHNRVGGVPTVWIWSAKLRNVHHGVHQLTVKNASTTSGVRTNAVDKFLFRLGTITNPLITPLANYSSSLVNKSANGSIYIQHEAAGADLFRYSTSFGRTWSDWTAYTAGNTTIDVAPWTGTDTQKWKGTHVRVQYFSRLTGSSDYIQEGDYDWEDGVPRRFPHLWWNGPYNQYGYDAGLDNSMRYNTKERRWKYDFLDEWPSAAQISVWGVGPGGVLDPTEVYGDVDNSSVIKKLPPSYLSSNMINITTPPQPPYLGWTISLNDANLRYQMTPVGSGWAQLVLFIFLWVLPILMGLIGAFIFKRTFYRIRLNTNGIKTKDGKLQPLWSKVKGLLAGYDGSEMAISNQHVLPDNATADVLEQRRTVLIATMEYNIEDWKIKVKIGGLGVMAQLMSQHLGHQNLIWVVPCVGDIEYPKDTTAEPIVVTILGKPYLVSLQYHVVGNITYALLDAPVFRQQTKAEPYPARMDDLDSAIYYSAWNQCIAEMFKRFPSIDLYHINDFHGCLAPLYLLPTRTIPVCLSLHNAEFQGRWPLRTQQEKKEVCSVFNLPVKTATNYCQFGNVFNLLYTGASYLRFHQRGFGAVGVSEKYGKRSWARYPIFWSLSKVGSLPNPDPSDTGAVGDNTDMNISLPRREERNNDKLQAQRWAGLTEDLDSDLLVFVGRWSKQKGVDLIADVMPEILSARPQAQFICVGPIIDLYGKLAASKLQRIMAMFPGRVFSQPEFTVLPPYIFSGADFTLIPSRDEPFGLVAVEFGRKGALGIGSRIGGLGQMPGWWYTVESDATRHLLYQLETAIKSALDSAQEAREEMRMISARQRFPVLEWIRKLEVLQRSAIDIQHANNRGTLTGPISEPPQPRMIRNAQSRPQEPQAESDSKLSPGHKFSLDPRAGADQVRKCLRKSFLRGKQTTETQLDREACDADANQGDQDDHQSRPVDYTSPNEATSNTLRYQTSDQPVVYGDSNGDICTTPYFSMPNSPYCVSGASSPAPRLSSDRPQYPVQMELESGQSTPFPTSGNISVLSLASVVGDRNQQQLFELQKVDPTFTDSMGHFTRRFEQLISNLDKKNSIADCCIETFLMKSERKFYNIYNDVQLNKDHVKESISPISPDSLDPRTPQSSSPSDSTDDLNQGDFDEIDRWLSRLGYRRPIAVQRFMRRRIGDWPVYALFLGLGQIIATNSAQITLLVGQIGETATRLYVIATIYCVSSIAWWFMYTRLPAVVLLSSAWFIYCMAFIVLSVSPFGTSAVGREWAQNVAAGIYAVASSSGSLFFALNFGDQGPVPVKDWMFRASLIQGLSQLYTVALWYWSSRVTAVEVGGVSSLALSTWRLTAVAMPIAVVCFLTGVLLALGLPKYYRQAPSQILVFYTSLFRRRTVLWFFFMVVVQNWFLVAAFGRNWSFLWSSRHAKTWQVTILVISFFIILWVLILNVFRRLSKEHSWILPVFGLSLGSPRWAQIWWGTSNIGLYLPWAGSFTSGAIVSRCLWLWLGVLDEVQKVGLGMVLLQTLTRVHVCFVLLAAQALGSIATICARGFAPNRMGPGAISPNVVMSMGTIGNAWFWIALFFQLLARYNPPSFAIFDAP